MSDPDVVYAVSRGEYASYKVMCVCPDMATAQRVVREHGLDVLARVLFNSNEFIYVD